MPEARIHLYRATADEHLGLLSRPSGCHQTNTLLPNLLFFFLFIIFRRSLPQLSGSLYFGVGDHRGIVRHTHTHTHACTHTYTHKGSPFIYCLSLKHLSLSIFWMTSLHCFTLQDKHVSVPVCPTSCSHCAPVTLHGSLPLPLARIKVNACGSPSCMKLCF